MICRTGSAGVLTLRHGSESWDFWRAMVLDYVLEYMFGHVLI